MVNNGSVQRLDIQRTFHILDHEDEIRLRTFLKPPLLALRSAPYRAELSIGQLRDSSPSSYWKAKMILPIVAVETFQVLGRVPSTWKQNLVDPRGFRH